MQCSRLGDQAVISLLLIEKPASRDRTIPDPQTHGKDGIADPHSSGFNGFDQIGLHWNALRYGCPGEAQRNQEKEQRETSTMEES